MTRDELQVVADTAWMILGPDGFGCVVAEAPHPGCVSIDVAGEEGGTIYHFNETFLRYEVEQMLGHTRYNYIREVVRCIRTAIKDLRGAQIRQTLGN
jgi:hypothetical protein